MWDRDFDSYVFKKSMHKFQFQETWLADDTFAEGLQRDHA